MSNHPNRSRVKTSASAPTLAQIAAARSDAGHTQTQAAALVYAGLRSWQCWEGGERKMPAAVFQLYKHLAGLEQIPFIAR